MRMKKNLIEYKRKYDLIRHHAWAGLGFLSVFLATRLLFPEISDLLQPILVVIIIYVLVSLLLTYKYYRGISVSHPIIQSSDEADKEIIQADVKKEQIKLEKKKVKAHIKGAKKSKKE